MEWSYIMPRIFRRLETKVLARRVREGEREKGRVEETIVSGGLTENICEGNNLKYSLINQPPTHLSEKKKNSRKRPKMTLS
jgi:hypothetical protein